MNISWQYLDKRNAAINALKDYTSMRYIIAHSEDEILNVRSSMEMIDASVPAVMPKASKDPQAGENRIISGIDKLNVLNARCRLALEFMDWFQPSWDALSENEQYILTQFYQCEDGKQIDNVYDISEHCHIERTSVYKRKDRALAHLALLLYGK